MSASGDRAAAQNLPQPSGDPTEDKYVAIKAAIDDSTEAAERWLALLQDTVNLDPDLGLRLWQRTYAEALIADDLDTCTRLVSESFSFGAQDASLLSRFRAGTEAIRSERYRAGLDMLTGLLRAPFGSGVAPLLSEINRALLLILIGRVLLYERTEGETAVADLEQASQHFEEARSLAPEDGRPYAALAEYYRLAGRLDEARRMCDEGAARAPHGPDVHLVRGLLFETEKLWDDADDPYDRAINAVGSHSDVAAVSRALERLLAPVSGGVYLRLGRKLQEHRPDLAQRAVEHALKVGPSRAARLRIENGDQHIQRAGFKLLGEIFESIARQSDAAAAYYQSALRYVMRSDHSDADDRDAADLFARAGSLDSGIVDMYWFWADALRVLLPIPKDGEVEDGLEAALRALNVWDQGYAIGPPPSRFAWAYLTRARVLASLAELQPDQAKEHWWQASVNLEQSLILDRGQGAVWLELARRHRSLGNYAVALQAVRVATLLGRESIEALYEQALIFAIAGGQGGMEAVRRLREKVLATGDRPERHAAPESIATGTDLVEALVLYWQRRPAAAIPLLDQAVDSTPTDVSLRSLRANARRLAGDRDGARQDFARIWEDTGPGRRAGDPVEPQIRADAGIELGHYAAALEILTDLLDIGSGDPFGVRMGLCYSSLGLGRTAQADRNFDEALVYLFHHPNVQSALDDLDSLEFRLGASEHGTTREAIARYRERLKARAQTLPNIEEPGAAEQEFGRVLDVARPEPGSSSWLSAHAGLARLDAEAGRLEQAASRFQAIMASDTGRTPPRFPEAGVALLRLASTEAQVGFAASEGADLPRTLGHFRRSLQLRSLAGVISTPLDLLDDVAGLIYSDEQRVTLDAALRELGAGAESKGEI